MSALLRTECKKKKKKTYYYPKIYQHDIFTQWKQMENLAHPITIQIPSLANGRCIPGVHVVSVVRMEAAVSTQEQRSLPRPLWNPQDSPSTSFAKTAEFD